MKLKFQALAANNWPFLDRLFGPRGACGGCWCMTWRLKRSEYEKFKGVGNKRLLKKIVKEGKPTGILAFHGSQPIGWCSVSPREDFIRLENSRILKKVDDTPVWSIVCLFVHPDYRNKNVSTRLIKAAVDFAKSNRATIVEAYPIEPKKNHMPDVFAFTGIASSFFGLGFKEVTRNSETRPIVRFTV